MTINYYNNNFYHKVFDDVLSKYKSKIWPILKHFIYNWWTPLQTTSSHTYHYRCGDCPNHYKLSLWKYPYMRDLLTVTEEAAHDDKQ